MRVACIDMGTNTTRLLVAEPAGAGLREVAAERVFTGLGRGRAPGEPLGAARVAQAAAVVGAQAARAAACGARRLRVVATAAIREAPDRDALEEAVRAAAPGASVEVLGAREEARLAFAGACGLLPGAPAGRIAVADIGGGSSELVIGTVAGGMTWSALLPLGSGLLADRHLRGDPPRPAELAALRRDVEAAFATIAVPSPDAAYAVGGSTASLRRVVGPRLDPTALRRAVGALVSMPAARAAERFELHPERVRLLPAAMILLEATARALGVPLGVCAGGLREGVVLEELRREADGQGT